MTPLVRTVSASLSSPRAVTAIPSRLTRTPSVPEESSAPTPAGRREGGYFLLILLSIWGGNMVFIYYVVTGVKWWWGPEINHHTPYFLKTTLYMLQMV